METALPDRLQPRNRAGSVVTSGRGDIGHGAEGGSLLFHRVAAVTGRLDEIVGYDRNGLPQ